MAVSVEWRTEGGGHTGLVAEGTGLWDAAKRLGVSLPAECGGRGECDTCAVVVEKGAAFLSEQTEAERRHLAAEALAAGETIRAGGFPVRLDKPDWVSFRVPLEAATPAG